MCRLVKHMHCLTLGWVPLPFWLDSHLCQLGILTSTRSRAQVCKCVCVCFAIMSSSALRSPAKGLKMVAERQMKVITGRIENNVELQLLVISYLDDLELNRNGVPGKGKKRKACEENKDTHDETDADEPGFKIDKDTTLNKHCSKFYGWKRNLVVELLQYVEPSIFGKHKKVKVDSLFVMKQLLEHGFDVEAFDDKSSDKPCTLNKLHCFDNLRAVYISLGRRFRNIDLVNGFVSWSSAGFFSVEDIRTDDGRKVRIGDKITDRVAAIPTDFLSGMSPTFVFTNEHINENWSWDKAALKFPCGRDLPLSSLFPKFRRQLGRKISEELGAVKPPVADAQPVGSVVVSGSFGSSSGGTATAAPASAAPAAAAKAIAKNIKVPLPPSEMLAAVVNGAEGGSLAKDIEEEEEEADEDAEEGDKEEEGMAS
jgi:hypothetical protein